MLELPVYIATSATWWQHQPCDPECSILANLRELFVNKLMNKRFALISLSPASQMWDIDYVKVKTPSKISMHLFLTDIKTVYVKTPSTQTIVFMFLNRLLMPFGVGVCWEHFKWHANDKAAFLSQFPWSFTAFRLYPEKFSVSAALSEPRVLPCFHRKMAPMKESLCSTPGRRTTWITARLTHGTAWGKRPSQAVPSVCEKTDPATFSCIPQSQETFLGTWPLLLPSQDIHRWLYLFCYTACTRESRGLLLSGFRWNTVAKWMFGYPKWLCTLTLISTRR